MENIAELLDSTKSWKEDYGHENGKYTCKCVYCQSYFMGHKRRVACKECDSGEVLDKPDFPEWIKSKHGADCMRWPITEPKYLENRLFWAFDAGRDRVWDQYMKQKEQITSLQKENLKLKEQLAGREPKE